MELSPRLVLPLLILILSQATGCNLDSEFRQVTSFSLTPLNLVPHDELTLTLTDQNDVEILRQSYRGGQGLIKQAVEPGTYSFSMTYNDVGRTVADSQFCVDDVQIINQITLVEGPNLIEVKVCSEDGIELRNTPTPQDEAKIALGRQLYSTHSCDSCHGSEGQGTSIAGPVVGSQCESCGNPTILPSVIADTMPISSPRDCNQDCAESITAYLKTK